MKEVNYIMEKSRILDIMAYYLSRYDMEAFLRLGFKTQSQGFKEIAFIFDKKDSYLRRLRDEYDVVTSNHRNGQCNRLPRRRIVNTNDYLSKFSFQELSELVESLILNANSKDVIDNDSVTYEVSGMSEEEIEYLINFKDSEANIKVVKANVNRRIYNTSILRQLKKLYFGQCQICGTKPLTEFNTDICEIHHIMYFSTSHNNDASNLIVLCPNHHRLIHKLNPIYDSSKKVFVFSDGREEKIKLDYHLFE